MAGVIAFAGARGFLASAGVATQAAESGAVVADVVVEAVAIIVSAGGVIAEMLVALHAIPEVVAVVAEVVRPSTKAIIAVAMVVEIKFVVAVAGGDCMVVGILSRMVYSAAGATQPTGPCEFVLGVPRGRHHALCARRVYYSCSRARRPAGHIGGIRKTARAVDGLVIRIVAIHCLPPVIAVDRYAVHIIVLIIIAEKSGVAHEGTEK